MLTYERERLADQTSKHLEQKEIKFGIGFNRKFKYLNFIGTNCQYGFSFSRNIVGHHKENKI